ncbi:MAG: hypothetical protein P1U87_18780 [Verrucomicrobiales bacterium]|nr:hypothetical protein [Verrucomicrobiales bacterium]
MRVVVVDGRRDEEPCAVWDILLDELENRGAEFRIFRLRELKMGSCIGCFGCWLKTPGECV